jgi:hypothetical protein
VRAHERVDQQETEGEQGDHDPEPGGAAPHSCAEASNPAISISPEGRSVGIGSGIARSTAGRGPATGNGDALTSLHLGKPADLVAVFSRVLAGIDAPCLQVLAGRAEDLGEVGADPFLAVLWPATTLIVGVAASRGWVDVPSLPWTPLCEDAAEMPLGE